MARLRVWDKSCSFLKRISMRRSHSSVEVRRTCCALASTWPTRLVTVSSAMLGGFCGSSTAITLLSYIGLGLWLVGSASRGGQSSGRQSGKRPLSRTLSPARRLLRLNSWLPSWTWTMVVSSVPRRLVVWTDHSTGSLRKALRCVVFRKFLLLKMRPCVWRSLYVLSMRVLRFRGPCSALGPMRSYRNGFPLESVTSLRCLMARQRCLTVLGVRAWWWLLGSTVVGRHMGDIGICALSETKSSLLI